MASNFEFCCPQCLPKTLPQEPQCMAWKDGVPLEWSSSTTSPLLPTHILAGFTTINYDQLTNLTTNQNLFNLVSSC